MVKGVTLAGLVALWTAGPGQARAGVPARCRAVLGEVALSAGSAGSERVRALQRAALHAAGLQAPALSVARARTAALLPQVGLSLVEGSQLAYSTASADSSDALRLGERRSLQVSLRWDLGAAVFAPVELQLRRQHQEEARAAATLSREVARLYFERRRLLSESGASGVPGSPAGTRRWERLAVLTAELDGLTGLCGLLEVEPLTAPLLPSARGAEADVDDVNTANGGEPTAGSP